MSNFFTTAEEYVRLKIKRNELFLKSLELQNQILKKEIVLSYRTVQTNDAKINTLKKINEIEETQSVRFLQETELSVNNLYMQVNDQFPQKYEELKSEIVGMQQTFKKMIEEVQQLNAQIPETLEFANIEYEIVPVAATAAEEKQTDC